MVIWSFGDVVIERKMVPCQSSPPYTYRLPLKIWSILLNYLCKGQLAVTRGLHLYASWPLLHTLPLYIHAVYYFYSPWYTLPLNKTTHPILHISHPPLFSSAPQPIQPKMIRSYKCVWIRIFKLSAHDLICYSSPCSDFKTNIL